MTTFDALLAYPVPTLLISALLLLIFVGRRYMLRFLLFNHAVVLPAAFYVILLTSSLTADALDVLSCLVFECLILLLCGLLLRRSLHALQNVIKAPGSKTVLYLLMGQVVCFVPLLSSSGFGIFSEGSRVAYLSEFALAKYLTYLNLLLSYVLVVVIACRISIKRKIHKIDLAVLLLNFALSALAGSKGAFFLWLASIFALIDYSKFRINGQRLMGIATLLGILFVLTGIVISSSTGITLDDYLRLVFARVFLANDARALAIDWREQTLLTGSLISESLRSLSNLFGTPPQNPPLGQYLYFLQFAVTGGNGANASLTALIMAYTPRNQAVFPIIIAMIAALVIYLASTFVSKLVRKRKDFACVVPILTFQLLYIFSQDFLAFQVVAPLVTLVFIAMIVIARWSPIRVVSRRTALESQPYAAIRRYPNTRS